MSKKITKFSKLKRLRPSNSFIVTSVSVAASLLVVTPVFAAVNHPDNQRFLPRSVVIGAVAAIDGNNIILTTRTGKRATTTTNYTVDISDASIIKDDATIIAPTNIKVGDRLLVRGIISGATVTAKSVIDGVNKPFKALGRMFSHFTHKKS